MVEQSLPNIVNDLRGLQSLTIKNAAFSPFFCVVPTNFHISTRLSGALSRDDAAQVAIVTTIGHPPSHKGWADQLPCINFGAAQVRGSH